MFFAIMDFLNTLFLLSWTLVYIQLLEAILQVIMCKDEIIISFPSLNKWTNGAGQSNLGKIFMMYN
jgi:hypothetical protein